MHLLEKSPDGWLVPDRVRETLLHRNGCPADHANRARTPSNRESSPLVGGEDSLSDSLSISPPPPVTEKQFSQTRNHRLVSRILDATRLLFDERVHGPASLYPDANRLLATLAEAYVRRESLRKPARVAYTNLKRGIDPGSEFLADPLAYLPTDFLMAIGMPVNPSSDLPPPEDEIDAAQGIDLPDDNIPPPVAHPSLARHADARAERSAAQVWELTLETLQGELPRSVFNARLADSQLAHYDHDSAVFTLAVRDEETRLWLQDRLAIKISRLLSGICDRSSRVRFETRS